MVSTELPGIGGEHLGSLTGQMEVEEDTFKEEMPEEERGGPAEELDSSDSFHLGSAKAILRSGRIVNNGRNEEPIEESNETPRERNDDEKEIPVRKDTRGKKIHVPNEEETPKADPSNNKLPSAIAPRVPYPGRLKKDKMEKSFKDIYNVLSKVFESLACPIGSHDCYSVDIMDSVEEEASKREFCQDGMDELIHEDGDIANDLRDPMEGLIGTEMKENESVVEYFTKVTSVVNQMASNGEVLDDLRVVQKVLHSLPENYFSLVTVLEQTKDLKNLTLEDLQGTLKAYEMKINLLFPPPPQPDKALKSQVTTIGGRGSFNHDRGRNFQGHGGFSSRGRGRNYQSNNSFQNDNNENQNFRFQQRGRGGRGSQRGQG
ncbi:hypothetical protein LWI29_024261 [Acer saccharum]|uniref:Uncharacterized protein n=1 Tax=Acer saccharum TaxID=4024 RepID=A0AA39W9D3_ACESA|nr:hypothetical protein LWI29_024261 [Acer saccharum]